VKQVWNKVIIKNTFNLCLSQAKTDSELNMRELYIFDTAAVRYEIVNSNKVVIAWAVHALVYIQRIHKKLTILMISRLFHTQKIDFGEC
jgi:hypothetical protein